MKRLAIIGLVALAAACSKDPPPATQTTAAQPATQAVTTPAVAADAQPATVGKPAPDFTLKDLDGKETKLSSFKGKTVVLEWFNPGCPFVNKAHTKGSLKDEPAKATASGVVWLAINSGAAGKQGAGVDANREGVKRFAMNYPVLLDESGAVGQKYGATNTPHVFVIDPTGTLIYKGAVDNSPDGEGEAPAGGKLVSYVDEAITASTSGKTPATAETKAYGCSVKYASH
jgi:peroxiredoxin